MKSFKQGDRVKVIQGIMAGHEGVVVRQIGNNWIVDFKADDTGLAWSINMSADEIELASQLELPLTTYYLGDYGHATSDEQKKKWKEEGRCEECGELLPMSIWGLGECPKHPKPFGGKQ